MCGDIFFAHVQEAFFLNIKIKQTQYKWFCLHNHIPCELWNPFHRSLSLSLPLICTLALSHNHYINSCLRQVFLHSSSFFLKKKKSRGGIETQEMGLLAVLIQALFLTLFLFSHQTKAEDFDSFSNRSRTSFRGRELAGRTCNWFRGKWVYDASYPLYDPFSCPFIDPQFNCQKYGRPDILYQKYRWMPFSCPLPRYTTSSASVIQPPCPFYFNSNTSYEYKVFFYYYLKSNIRIM